MCLRDKKKKEKLIQKKRGRDREKSGKSLLDKFCVERKEKFPLTTTSTTQKEKKRKIFYNCFCC